MQRSLILAAAAFIPSVTSQASAAEWVEAGRTNKTTYYVDVASISKDGGIVSTQVKRVWGDNPDGWFESILQEKHDCGRHRVMVTLMQSHHRNGSVSERTVGKGLPGIWEMVAPAPAIMRQIHTKICEF